MVVKYLILSFLLAIAVGVLMAFIITPEECYNPAVLYIDAISDNGNLDKIYKEFQELIVLRDIQDISSIDTINNKIKISFFIDNDMIADKCEEVLNDIIQNKDIKGWVMTFYIDYT